MTTSDEGETNEEEPIAGESTESKTRVQHSPPSEAFSALSDPLRVDILRELSAQQRQSGDNVVGFAELRKQVEVEDSGRFRYHLKQLEDNFIEKTESGYTLTHAGLKVVAAIIAGTYTTEQALGPVELESECPKCSQSAVATYDGGRCLVTCANDHILFTWGVPPNATAGLDLSEVIDLAELLAFQAIEQAIVGVCPECYDPISPQIRTDESSRPVFNAVCNSCGAQIVGPIDFCLFVDPEVAAFCQRHGHSLRDNHVWESLFVGDSSEMTVIDDDPLHIEFGLTVDGDSLSGTVSEDGHVTVTSASSPKT